MDFHNETAIVTGATSGIGKKIAELLLDAGCKVAICSRNAEHVQNTMNEFHSKYGDRVFGNQCDVSDPNQIKEFVTKVVQTFGSIRILIANAGLSLSYGPFEYLSPESVAFEAKTIINTNLLGVINTISIVLPQMKKQDYGRIITLSGGGAERPIDNMTLYSASKGGVLAFSRCLAVEFEKSQKNIKLNIFQPGMQKTGLTTIAKVVPGWRDPSSVSEDLDLVLKYMGGELDSSCRKILPFVSSSCKKCGQIIRGVPIMKMITGGIKLQKEMKQKKETTK